jgi:predicted outer membrane protein
MLAVKRLGLVAGVALLGVALLGVAPLGLASATAARGAAAPSQQDTRYLQAIHQANLAEISAGNLTRQNGTNKQVQDLGAKFVKDHEELDKAAQSTASSAKATLPDSPNADQQAVLSQLQGVSGAAFDAQWISAELTAHQRNIQLTQTELGQGSDPAIKKVAQSALPTLQAHFDALLSLAKMLGVPAPAIPSGPKPSGSPGAPSPARS